MRPQVVVMYDERCDGCIAAELDATLHRLSRWIMRASATLAFCRITVACTVATGINVSLRHLIRASRVLGTPAGLGFGAIAASGLSEENAPAVTVWLLCWAALAGLLAMRSYRTYSASAS